MLNTRDVEKACRRYFVQGILITVPFIDSRGIIHTVSRVELDCADDNYRHILSDSLHCRSFGVAHCSKTRHGESAQFFHRSYGLTHVSRIVHPDWVLPR